MPPKCNSHFFGYNESHGELSDMHPQPRAAETGKCFPGLQPYIQYGGIMSVYMMQKQGINPLYQHC